MSACKAGAADAFEELFRRYRQPMSYPAAVPEAGHAEELAQEVFVAVLQAARRYEPLSPFRISLRNCLQRPVCRTAAIKPPRHDPGWAGSRGADHR
jgi:DNA-directed RNA polymerase specialized sigma24 family protein